MQRIIHYIDNNKILKLLTNREVFIRIYIVCCILWYFPALGVFVDPICKVCFIWGAALIVYDVLGKRIVFRASYWYWFIAMMAMYCITIFINIQNNFYMGVKHLIYMGIAFMIVFTQNGHLENYHERKLMRWVNIAITVIAFWASSISLIMYCLQISIRFEQNGVTFRQGFLENRLFGVYGSPNIGALFSIICIALLCINSYLEEKSLIKWRKRHILNGIIQLIYFSLTLSNGGFLTAVAFIILVVFVFVFIKLKKNRKILISILISFLITVASVFGLSLAVKGIRILMSAVPSVVEYAVERIEEDEPVQVMPEIVFERIESGDDVSNGRTAIWGGSLKIWIQSPIFGIADARVDAENPDNFAYSLDNLNDSEMERMLSVDGNLHNAYIQILTNSGLAGFLCFFMLIILIVKKYFKYLLVEDTRSSSYKITGMLFCILGAMGVNGLVENHLLFNRQDPLGIIFWFFLGCGLILIHNALSESRLKDYVCSEQKEQFLFACDTPLQLFNSINFVENNQMEAKERSDLVIIHQFHNSHEIAERIRKQGIFCHVYDADPINEKKSVKSKVHTLLRIFWSHHAVKKIIKNDREQMSYRHRYYFLSFQTPVTISFQLANPFSDVYLMEDGLGTYVGNIEDDYTSALYKIINKYFLEYRMSLKPQAVYLNNPQICRSRIDAEFRKLVSPKGNPECLEKLMDIFHYSAEKQSSSERFIYMTQPLEETEGYIKDSETGMIQTLQDELDSGKVEVRVHPRQKDYQAKGLRLSDSSQMWELECIYKINSDQVLISAYSTTLFMPKILNNTEPTLIFVYKIFFSGTEETMWKEREKFIKDFAAGYSNPAKVFIPADMQEFRKILKELC